MHLLRRSFGDRASLRTLAECGAQLLTTSNRLMRLGFIRTGCASAPVPTTSKHEGRTGGKRTTILSIDGGGVRGVLASTILESLEKSLQEIDGPEVALADYFDVIAGTSTGGLLTAMLTAPDENGRPKFSAKRATQAYIEEASVIFPSTSNGFLRHWWRMARGPKHDEQGLVATVERLVGDCRLKDTVTKVVIPAFDISLQQPVFFSSARAKRYPLDDPTLSQVCLGTAAAPILLPAVHFTTTNPTTGEERHYHLVDGGVACNNPTAVAIMQVIKEVKSKGVSWRGSKDVLVLSLGTGEKLTSYDARKVAKWGILGWVRVRSCGSIPILDIFSNGSSDMVDYNLAMLFHKPAELPGDGSPSTDFGSDESFKNYLRIQTDALDITALDNASEQNMRKLVAEAEKLLTKRATTRNLDTGKLEPCSDGSTNAESLRRFAKWMSDERGPGMPKVQS